MATPGIRNNNPGNIRHDPDNKWQGMADIQDSPRFVQFISPVWGIRAMSRLLINYYDRHGLNTVKGIIERWAPPVENDTKSYIESVCFKLGVKPKQVINLHDYNVLKPLVKEIIFHENGKQPYTEAQIDKGLLLAGVEPAVDGLNKSRTIKGAQVAAGATVASGAVEASTEIFSIQEQIQPLIQYSETIKFVFLALTLIGVGLVVYARFDDKRKGLR